MMNEFLYKINQEFYIVCGEIVGISGLVVE